MSQEVVEPAAQPEARSAPVARKTPQRSRARWRIVARALGEIAVVTAGILIAFALEAWWDNRATAQREQVHLRALASDFQQNVAVLRSLIDNQESIMSSSRALLDAARGSRQNSPESVAELMNQVFNSARYDPVMGAYEALLNSGGLMLIRDESLRASLAEFAAQVNGRYYETWANEQYFAFNRDFGGPFVLHSPVTQGEADRNRGSDRDRVYAQMLSDPRFQEHLAMRYVSERDMAAHYRKLLQRAESVLAQLHVQIEE